MSVFKVPRTPFWQTEFEIGGHRFRETTGATSRREAESYERTRKIEERARAAEIKAQPASAPNLINLAFDRYWIEQGSTVANAKDILRDMTRIVAWCSAHKPPIKLLTEITDPLVHELVQWRSKHSRWDKPQYGPITKASVNRSTTQVLRRVFQHARKKWKMSLSNEPDWGEHLLDEPKERIRILRDDEDRAIRAEMSGDYDTVRDFALVSGLRQSECLLLWSQVDMEGLKLDLTGKGDVDIMQPITPAMHKILLACVGDDPYWVFTYRAEVTREGRVAGKRYPITTSGLKTHWRRARKAAAKVAPTLISQDRRKSFRWHDTRHDFATRLLASSGNLRLVQRSLGHAKLETTGKYAHAMIDALRDAMTVSEDKLSERRGKR